MIGFSVLERVIKLNLSPGQSAFFFGPRKTGKSTYLKHKFAGSKYYDLLKTDEFTRLMKEPHLLREEILALKKLGKLIQPVIIDEVQKIPTLLDEIHWLIENENISFILCGSSARKLHKAGVNLLGGRAIGKKCYPLVSAEFKLNNKDFNLLNAMQRGLVPSNYLTENYKPLLESYVNDYLTQEIKNESLVRNLPAFSKFLESVGFTNGELINYSNIAADCAVSANTIKEYYQILVDTLVGYFIYPLKFNHKRQVISATPKFYLFDVGVANWLSKISIVQLNGTAAGKSFEHFIYLELLAYSKYYDKFIDITYWRTKSGLEVDFIISENREIKLAIECKLSKQAKKNNLKGIFNFAEDYQADKLIVISQDPEIRLLKSKTGQVIIVMPWQVFLEDLWQGNIF